MGSNRIAPGVIRPDTAEIETIVVEKPVSPAPDGFFMVWLDTLRVDAATGFSLYLPRGSSQPVLYREPQIPFTESTKRKLQDVGVRYLLVSEEDRDAFQRYLETHLSAIIDDPRVPDEQKSKVIYDTTQWLLEEMFSSDNLVNIAARTANVARQTMQFIQKGREALHHLVKVMSFDYYTCTHSVNVYVFSMSLANAIGMDNTLMERFGQGALVHDIGKRKVDKSILNHKGKLSPEQWAIMKKHPEWGAEILEQEGVRDSVVIDVTLHHHEKLDGTGYPHGLKGDEISLCSRILTVADIFDALTTRRCYKNAITTFESLQLMRREMASQIDMNIYATLVRLMAKV